MTYSISLKVDGQWKPVTRGFETLDGATAWAQDVLAEGLALGITGYRIIEGDGRVCCSVEQA